LVDFYTRPRWSIVFSPNKRGKGKFDLPRGGGERNYPLVCRNSNDRLASAKISSADWSGHTASPAQHRLRFPEQIQLQREHFFGIRFRRQRLKNSTAEILESRAKVGCQIIGYVCGLLELRAVCG
jgi:hypothetical protein